MTTFRYKKGLTQGREGSKSRKKVITSYMGGPLDEGRVKYFTTHDRISKKIGKVGPHFLVT